MASVNRINVGDQFGRLIVVARDETYRRRIKYLCKCTCGRTTSVFAYHLRRGATRSCGCLMIENRTKGAKFRHGHAKSSRPTTEYRIWQGMLDRCSNENAPAYKWYGARGIRVCERWKASFVNFLTDMGPRPTGLSMDRINNNGDYEPANCRWATNAIQLKNRRQPARDTETGRYLPTSK